MKKRRTKNAVDRKTISSVDEKPFDSNIRFIVSMPGRSTYKNKQVIQPLTKFHKFGHNLDDIQLEEFQAQFLMQRDYLID